MSVEMLIMMGGTYVGFVIGALIADWRDQRAHRRRMEAHRARLAELDAECEAAHQHRLDDIRARHPVTADELPDWERELLERP